MVLQSPIARMIDVSARAGGVLLAHDRLARLASNLCRSMTLREE
jgi:hypothetical protein